MPETEERFFIVGAHAARVGGAWKAKSRTTRVRVNLRRVTTRHWALLTAAVGGIVLALSGPPTDFVLGPWIGPALFYAGMVLTPELGARPPSKWRWIGRFFRAGAVGFAFGLTCNAFTFRFVPAVILRFTSLSWAVGALAVFLLAAAHALRFFVAELFHRFFVRHGVHRLFSFALAMYLGTFVPMLFPWTTGGAGMRWPVTVQLADLIGERGLVALFAVVSALAGEAGVALVRKAPRHAILAPLGASAALMAAIVGYGAVRMRSVDAERAAAPKAKIALVQPSIEALERWERGRAENILSKLSAVTRRAEAAGAELVVWPEAAYPYSMGAHSVRAPVGPYAPLQRGVHGPILTGTITHDEDEAMNSAVVVARDGTITPPYHKMHLLWFGETVPLADVWPWLRRQFARGTGLTPGNQQVLLHSDKVNAAVLNCFEDTLPAAGREAAGVNPNLFVNITNDSWFSGSQESALHLRVASMRTVEARRDMIRAVNFGPTTWVDANGRLVGRLDPPEPNFLMTEPALLDRPITFYAHFGDGPWLLVAAAGLAYSIRKHRRTRTAAQ